ncbi:hypothetical protein [Nostoc sp.]|uniref:hypothetical protein n=1 Tax=Nostoc sp. TaxID=1180 RepID=UPI002FF44954
MTKPPRCIVCKTTFLQGHSFYTGLCVECGNLNFSKRQQTADLRGTIAIVTGGRVKIGHGVALRLLRNGATVITTSRFPHDAAKRYATEPDFLEWQHRLQIYGLDLRHSTVLSNLPNTFANFIRDSTLLSIMQHKQCVIRLRFIVI